MGFKRVLRSYQIIPNAGVPNVSPAQPAVSGVMTGTTVITSNPTNISNWDNVGLQVQWTGTPVGTFQILCSIDGVTFIPLTFGPPLTPPAGTPGSFLVNLTELPYPWIQLQYTNASGVGALKSFICAKDLN